MSILPDLPERLKAAVAFAHDAGQRTLEFFRRDNLQIDVKGDKSPVTIADREAELLLRERIAAAFPDDGILGEEFPERPGKSECRWILDPIDGTRSFVYGVPLYGNLVAMEYRGESVLGVINVPALRECVFAAVGQGAWYRRGEAPPQPAKVSATAQLADSLFSSSDVSGFVSTGRRDIFDRLLAKVAVHRTWGDCYGYMLVATGRADLMVDPIMNLWDTAALKPILEEAGGTFTDFQGCATTTAGESIATNGRLLAEVLEITRKSSRTVIRAAPFSH